MNMIFYLAALVAISSTALVVTSRNAIHALLYLIVSLFAVALIFYVIGAPLAAALEVIIYAGAIMVLFVFVVMMLNLGEQATAQERRWLQPRIWFGPAVLAALLLAELLYVIVAGASGERTIAPVSAHDVGMSLFGAYLLAVEVSAMLLLAALVGAYHLGQRMSSAED
ncbi:MAG: NADH-quinone oxidoreductase subunit J [Nitrococcus mobilis]|nr:NADH-quinone oxidoreductase subunit J [Nitrococcus mobilis]